MMLGGSDYPDILYRDALARSMDHGSCDARVAYDETIARAIAQDAKLDSPPKDRDAKLRTVAHHIRYAKLLMDEIFAEEMRSSKRTLAELAQESQRWGMYADADTPEKSPLAPTRIATTDELRRLDRLKANAWALDHSSVLQNAGIGDVPCNPRAAHDAKIAFDVTWDASRDHASSGTPAETAYLASFAPNPHPMIAESLRDEYEKTNEGTGL